uniref:Ig-like domain-containing protein n=1 Tax=Ficedula albicollis TaxID=59894 RepID=A0A803VG42_FICAL
VPMSGPSPGRPCCPCPRGVRATRTWRVGGCDTKLSPGSLSTPLQGSPPGVTRACPCSGDIPEHPSAGGPPCWNWGPGDIGCDRSPLSPDSLVLQVPARALLEGDTVTLRCRRRWDLRVNSVSFYRDGEELGTLHNGTELSLPPLQLGHYLCRVSDGDSAAESVPLNVTVLGERDPRVRPGDPVTLRCSVQVGSAPVTFTWLRDGREVARGPLLELGAVDVGHSGTYQCVATNQLGQDGHRVFRALSPELALEVTSWDTGGVTRGRCEGLGPRVPVTPLSPHCHPIVSPLSPHCHPLFSSQPPGRPRTGEWGRGPGMSPCPQMAP